MGEEPDLVVGQRGYFREFGKTYPARVVAVGIVQTFGPIDNVIAYTENGYSEHIDRLVGRSRAGTSGHWIDAEDYAQERRAQLAEQMANNLAEYERLGS